MSREQIRKISYQLSSPFPLKWLIHLSGQKFIFPFYHTVSDKPSPAVKHLYPVLSKKQFSGDLDFLLRYFSPADFDEVLALSRYKKQKGKPRFFLSFDDGFMECLEIIAPILKKKGIQAAFFINPAFVGNKKLSHRQKISFIIDKILNLKTQELNGRTEKIIDNSFKDKNEFIQYLKNLTITDAEIIDKIALNFEIDFEEVLKDSKPYLGIPELLELQSNGFIIGSHGFDHPEFQLLSNEEMKKQIESSFQFLESNLKTKHRVFSFPFHDIGIPKKFFDYLKNEANVEISFGTSGIKRDEATGHIHRIPMELPGFNSAETIIRSEYFYYIGKSLFGKNLVKRR